MRNIIMAVALLMISVSAQATTITWTNPTQYVDNSAISTANQATIQTKLYYGSTSAGCTGATSPFATVSNGAQIWTGTLPVTTKGSTTYYCGTATIPSEGMESAKSDPPVAFTVPFVAPGRPSLINVTP